MTYEEEYRVYVNIVEETLIELLGEKQKYFDVPEYLRQSMEYSVMAGGKRVRPVLMLAASQMLGVELEKVRFTAAAIEMIHTYSLIHDDLPGMDDDDLRRGRPTNHKVFGVGHAILAGDGLLNTAYEVLLGEALKYPENMHGYVTAARAIAGRAGICGMIAGQSLDLLSENQEADVNTLQYIHRHKTADLLTAPLEAAACIAGGDEQEKDALMTYGYAMGVAFQIDDDLLDIEGDVNLLGKKTGMDKERGKLTWPSLVGIGQAKEDSKKLWQTAEAALDCFGARAGFLREFADRLSKRKR